jgi:hypothetical protein
MKMAIGWILMIGLCGTSARAVDGVLEIHQLCATGTGCFAGDTGGFPVSIDHPGSYRLTGNLVQPNPNTNLIVIGASGVSIDLNGFTIQGANAGPGCTTPGFGSGLISLDGANDIELSNGHIRGMPAMGADLRSSAPSRVDRVSAERNCSHGIWVGNGSIVSASTAMENGGWGIVVNPTSHISGSVANQNSFYGIVAPNGGVSIEECVANANTQIGINSIGPNASRISDSTANGNGVYGIRVGIGSLVLRSTTNQNGQFGMLLTGGAIGLGFLTVNNNGLTGAASISGTSAIALVGCSILGGTQSCP